MTSYTSEVTVLLTEHEVHVLSSPYYVLLSNYLKVFNSQNHSWIDVQIKLGKL